MMTGAAGNRSAAGLMSRKGFRSDARLSFSPNWRLVVNCVVFFVLFFFRHADDVRPAGPRNGERVCQ